MSTISMNWDIFHVESSRRFAWTYRYIVYICFDVVGADANTCIYSSVVGMTTTGKIANNGLALHHRNVGYVAKGGKICIPERRRCGWIERRDTFLWMTRHFNGASKRTKFGVILGRRHNEYAISSITGLHRRPSFFPYFSHTRASERILERIFQDQKDWLNQMESVLQVVKVWNKLLNKICTIKGFVQKG